MTTANNRRGAARRGVTGRKRDISTDKKKTPKHNDEFIIATCVNIVGN